MLFESAARLLLVAHALLAGTLVALTTHHLVWIFRSRGTRRRGEPRFALLASLFFFAAFIAGSCLYPTYRVRVRAEFFDSPAAIVAERAVHLDQAQVPEPVAAFAAPRVARLFDVKEHLAALGLLASACLVWLSRRTSPMDPSARLLYVALASYVCVASWGALVIGLYTASIRAVGSAP